jgi:hypothetical protein
LLSMHSEIQSMWWNSLGWFGNLRITWLESRLPKNNNISFISHSNSNYICNVLFLHLKDAWTTSQA